MDGCGRIHIPSATRDFWCVSVIRRMHASNRAMAWLENLIKAVGRQVPDDDAGLGRCLQIHIIVADAIANDDFAAAVSPDQLGVICRQRTRMPSASSQTFCSSASES